MVLAPMYESTFWLDGLMSAANVCSYGTPNIRKAHAAVPRPAKSEPKRKAVRLSLFLRCLGTAVAMTNGNWLRD